MNIEVTMNNGKKLTCDIGNSKQAKKAIESYDKYLENGAYIRLKRVFSNLYFIAEKACKNSAVSNNAVLATYAIATSDHENYEDNKYKQYYILNNINCIYTLTDRTVPAKWMNKLQTLMDDIKKDFDPDEAEKAGVVIVVGNEKDSEYSQLLKFGNIK